MRIAGDAEVNVEGAAGCDAHLSRLTERLLRETQSLDQ